MSENIENLLNQILYEIRKSSVEEILRETNALLQCILDELRERKE